MVAFFFTSDQSKIVFVGQTKCKTDYVCICNAISCETLKEAIASGCHTLEDIQNQTFATVGPCGGSCKPKVLALLKTELEKLK